MRHSDVPPSESPLGDDRGGLPGVPSTSSVSQPDMSNPSCHCACACTGGMYRLRSRQCRTICPRSPLPSSRWVTVRSCSTPAFPTVITAFTDTAPSLTPLSTARLVGASLSRPAGPLRSQKRCPEPPVGVHQEGNGGWREVGRPDRTLRLCLFPSNHRQGGKNMWYVRLGI